MLTLSAGPVRVTVVPEAGGRIGSVAVDGVELLVTAGLEATGWGLFPMVPFAGRIRNGRFSFDGEEVTLPRTMGGHAIHGTVLEAEWEVVDAGRTHAVLQVHLGEPWPFPGRARHRIDVDAGALRLELEVEAAARPMPVTVGWHPWFRRTLAAGSPAVLELEAAAMYRRDLDHITTAELVAPPPPGPWDDCFVGVERPPVIRWPGALAVRCESTCDHWVVFDELPGAVCVEPQTGPPDAVNLGAAAAVEPGRPLRAAATFAWSTAAP